jgi:putative ABC transport system ATP-binding protein
MTREALYQLKNIVKAYGRNDAIVPIFDGFDLKIDKGDFIALMGPSGSGKTTLLNMLGGIDRPTSGQVYFGNERLDTMSEAELSRWRANHVGFVFQSFNLLPMLSAARNVALPLELTALKASERRKRVTIALQLMGLDECRDRVPAKLSGGQQQRVAIARAIVADTKVLLCDEPTGNLDRASSTEVLEILRTLNERYGKTIVMVTHDQRVADCARKTYHLDKGQFVDASTMV